MIVWYDCPVCGKPHSSDGEHFCGECEERYREEQEALEAMIEEDRARQRSRCLD